MSFDPYIAATAESHLRVWRALPLPVADRYFKPIDGVGDATAGPLFLGRSTPHREAVLLRAKHHNDVQHQAYGIDHQDPVTAGRWVAINVHNHPYPNFENRVLLHMAAGHLVLSEPLSPLHGLEPGIDHLTFADANQLLDMLFVLRDTPGQWHGVRVRGRHKAEEFRASRVWPRVVADLRADLRAFGTTRRRAL
jgi:hypothetical protein